MDKLSYKKLGLYLRQKRQNQNVTQVQLAEKLGYTSQFIANWERGASSPPPEAIRRLVDILKIPQAEMLFQMNALQNDFWQRTIFYKKQRKS